MLGYIMRDLPKQIIQRPNKLDPTNEQLALKILSAKRGRGINDGAKDLGKIAQSFAPNAKSEKIKQLQNLKNQWRDIMGENIAKLCTPEAIKGKTLCLRVIGAASPLIEMRKREILGLATLASGTELSKLQMIQSKLTKPDDKNLKLQPLDAQQSQMVEEKLAPLSNERLKNALRLLNGYILNKS
jgi:hypothetical protein